eukprot:scaffold2177_cov272-Pinguiococcus_pyrenoidosus.AAC.21
MVIKVGAIKLLRERNAPVAGRLAKQEIPTQEDRRRDAVAHAASKRRGVDEMIALDKDGELAAGVESWRHSWRHAAHAGVLMVVVRQAAPGVVLAVVADLHGHQASQVQWIVMRRWEQPSRPMNGIGMDVVKLRQRRPDQTRLRRLQCRGRAPNLRAGLEQSGSQGPSEAAREERAVHKAVAVYSHGAAKSAHWAQDGRESGQLEILVEVELHASARKVLCVRAHFKREEAW